MPRQAIFILTDTQGTDVIGCYGRPEMKTPHIDRMASEGIRFDKAYSTQPVCGPARSAIFTGVYPHSNGVLGNDMAPALDMKTLGQRLLDLGVRTGFVGKWHLDGTDYFGNGICPDGWDPEYWFDGRCYLESLNDKRERDFSRRVPTAQDMRDEGFDEAFTMAHRSVDKAIDFIERYKDEDFFLVVSIDEPHHPFICPAEYLEAFEGFEYKLGANAKDDLADKPQSQRDWAEHVAEFMGGWNVFDGFSIRRDRTRMARGHGAASNTNAVPGTVHGIEYQGSWVKVTMVRKDNGEHVVANESEEEFFNAPVDFGDPVTASWNAEDSHALSH